MATNRGRIGLTAKQEVTAATQFGSLGSGNHFFEICLDETDQVWVVLHSGSRGIGDRLAKGHIGLARKKATERPEASRPDLGFSREPGEYETYIRAMSGRRTTPWPTAPQ